MASEDRVDKCTPSTSPLYWDIDENGDNGGPKPSELYGKHIWEIHNYSQITEKKLKSNVFKAGSYKWYILFYPQGNGVSGHLSLFLNVANADKLLPGWSQLVHFTIGVVNKDLKKSISLNGLLHFRKKGHSWGWNKYIELCKLEDGFIVDDTLIIEAHVQVIRERADRPFRCLEAQYRGILIRWYRTEVEQIFRHFVEEGWAKLGKLIEDRTRWSSFYAFWSKLDAASRRRMSLVEMDSTLKVIVKLFFIEKTVTSALAMDALYSGLKTLEGQRKGKMSKAVHSLTEEYLSVHLIIERDSFILVDDALHLLERAASYLLPPKYETCLQNRMKDTMFVLVYNALQLLERAGLKLLHPKVGKGAQDEAVAEEFNEDTDECDERRLTELGRQAIEIFVLKRIFRKIEAAYRAMNATPSSPLCWDSDEDEDEDEDDGAPKPYELYGWHRWEIKKYSQITKRRLPSKAFAAGGCKWYVLFYPQGGVSNKHLSLFLYVANADKLLPGWSHLVYFEIGVLNKDPKKSRCLGALCRFWKKEDSWGWDQCMELSKLEDGFIDDDTLIIQARVQVIRERADRPFPCLYPQYRLRLIGSHRPDVEQIFHDFVEERLAKLRKLTEDKSRWSSLCAFWSNVDPASRRRMSLVKMDSILRVIVKHFPIDGKVDSIVVMDSIYNGLNALKGQHKGKKSKDKAVHSHTAEEEEDLSVHLIRMEKDSFILMEVDDALQLLERDVAFPPKDEEGPQDRDAIERRLNELGRQAIEIFVLSQIFSEIEAVYEEDVAFKKQEELIGDEEEENKSQKKQDDEEKKSPPVH